MGVSCGAIFGRGFGTAGSLIHFEPAAEPPDWGRGRDCLMSIVGVCRCVCGDDAEAVQGVVMAEERAAGSVWIVIGMSRGADEGLGGSAGTWVLRWVQCPGVGSRDTAGAGRDRRCRGGEVCR